MAWTRRRFLYSTTVLGAAAVSGCSSKLGGTPRADPDARAAAEQDVPSSAPEESTSLAMGVLKYEPFVIEGGELTGAVPEVARAVLGQLGVTDLRFQVLEDIQALYAGIAAGAFDMAGGLTIDKNTCQSVAFTTPDYVSGTALIVPGGNPKGLNTYADIQAKGAKVAVMSNLPEQTDATTAGVNPANIVALPDPLQMMDAVRGGQADCAAFDDISSRTLVESGGEGLTVAKPFTPPGRLPLVGAFAFPRDKTELLESFNNRLRDLHASGDWLTIVSPFGLSEEHIPPPDLTAEKACAGG